MHNDLHDAVAQRADELANQLKPAGFTGWVLGDYDVAWLTHRARGWHAGWIGCCAAMWLTGAGCAFPCRALGCRAGPVLEFAGTSCRGGTGLGWLERTFGRGIAEAGRFASRCPAGFLLGPDPEFQVSPWWSSCVFPKAVSAIGDFVLVCSFGAHNPLFRLSI